MSQDLLYKKMCKKIWCDCPKELGIANDWTAQMNEGKDKEHMPTWEFKEDLSAIDLMGSIVSIKGSFTPPHESVDFSEWKGELSVFLFDRVIFHKNFSAKKLDDLRRDINEYLVKDLLKMTLFTVQFTGISVNL